MRHPGLLEDISYLDASGLSLLSELDDFGIRSSVGHGPCFVQECITCQGANAQTRTRRGVLSGRMDEQQKAARAFLRRALEKTGWSATRLAREAGVSSTTITRPLNSEAYKFIPKQATLAKIAEAATIEIPDILNVNEGIDTFPVRSFIPLRGEVRAGAWEEIPDEPTVIEWLPMAVPDYAGASLFALRVVGRSMDLIYPDGTIVILCPPSEAGVRENDRVVVQRYDSAGRAETTLKEVIRKPNGAYALVPRSSDPNHQQELPMHVDRDEAVDDGYTIVGVVIARYNTERRGRGPLLT